MLDETSFFDYNKLIQYFQKHRATLIHPQYPKELIASRGRWFKKIPLYYDGNYIFSCTLMVDGMYINHLMCLGEQPSQKKLRESFFHLTHFVISQDVPIFAEVHKSSSWSQTDSQTTYRLMVINPTARDPWDLLDPDHIINLKELPVDDPGKGVHFEPFGCHLHWESKDDTVSDEDDSINLVLQLVDRYRVVFVTSNREESIQNLKRHLKKFPRFYISPLTTYRNVYFSKNFIARYRQLAFQRALVSRPQLLLEGHCYDV